MILPGVSAAEMTKKGDSGHTPFYAVSVNCLYRDRVRDRVSVSVRVRACRPDSSGNLLTRRKMEFAR